MDREVTRKQRFSERQEKFLDSNGEIRESKILFRDESRKLLERLEAEHKEKEEKRKSADDQLRYF